MGRANTWFNILENMEKRVSIMSELRKGEHQCFACHLFYKLVRTCHTQMHSSVKIVDNRKLFFDIKHV